MYLIDRTALAYPGEICALGYWVRFQRLTCPHLLNMSISGRDSIQLPSRSPAVSRGRQRHNVGAIVHG